MMKRVSLTLGLVLLAMLGAQYLFQHSTIE